MEPSDAEPRLLFLDDGLPRRLAAELGLRGRRFRTVEMAGLTHADDRELLRALTGRLGSGAVFVTADRALAAAGASSGLTVALVGVRLHGLAGEAAKRETVHRWAHAMATQRPGSVMTYTPRRRRPFAASG